MKDFVNLTRVGGSNYSDGLRIYMNNIYKYMSFALLITGFVAYFVANTPALLKLIFGSPLSIVVMLAPLLYVFYFS